MLKKVLCHRNDDTVRSVWDAIWARGVFLRIAYSWWTGGSGLKPHGTRTIQNYQQTNDDNNGDDAEQRASTSSSSWSRTLLLTAMQPEPYELRCCVLCCVCFECAFCMHMSALHTHTNTQLRVWWVKICVVVEYARVQKKRRSRGRLFCGFASSQ